MKAIRLKVNDQKDPAGIGVSHPLFSWNTEGGITQKAFQLSLFEPDVSEVFNTGKTESSSMRYRMESSLKEDTDYCRKVTVWDENGYIETAYKMLENTKAPGWLAMADKGATTVRESYIMYDENGHPIGHSMNHYSPGAVCSFLYEKACGIRLAGENRFVIRPLPGGTLEYASASYNSPYGKASSGWEKKGDTLYFEITIPSNCTAEIILPDGRSEQVKAGSYHYSCVLKV